LFSFSIPHSQLENQADYTFQTYTYNENKPADMPLSEEEAYEKSRQQL
jgi:hypothetical protein